jgi:hypothetical protein
MSCNVQIAFPTLFALDCTINFRIEVFLKSRNSTPIYISIDQEDTSIDCDKTESNYYFIDSYFVTIFVQRLVSKL